ncbi:MAG: MFS transporter [Rickettsiales bacterium]|nr:MFS transporter [Rickettsiales bacterium]
MLRSILRSSKALLTILFFSILFGLYTYSNLPREADPDISLPVIYVSLIHQGISPNDSERLLIKPLEKELKNIEGIKKMSSTSYLGGGNIVLKFDAGFNAQKALNDTRVKIDLVKNKLPSETEEPVVTEVNLSRFPVLAIAISGTVEKRALMKIAKELKNNIENISEVLEVKTIGEDERQIDIIVDPKTVKTYGLTAKEILLSLKNSNILIPAGTLNSESGSFNIKVPGLFENINDILALPIKSNNNSVVTLKDIAEIRDSFKDIKGFARNNGKNAVILEVSKRTGENIIETINKIKTIVINSKKIYPEELEIAFFQDESKAINTMISDLENNVILAVILVLIIIISWMGIKSALLVSISIPGSFLISMIFLSFLGVTINIVVLFSLILSVGILIDGAIIVVEYANRRSSENNEKNVFLISAEKMAIPVVASTLTTLAAFFPLIFWPGMAGEFMYYLPITLLTVLTSSLLMALIFIPVLGNVLGSDSHNLVEKENLRLLESGELSRVTGIQKLYISILDSALKNPLKIVISTFILLFLIQIIYSKIGKGFEFFPPIEPDYAEVVIHARGNLSIFDKDKIVKKVENIVLKNEFIRNSYSKSGIMKGNANKGAEDIIGTIKIEFINWKKRPKAKFLINELLSECNKIAGIKVEIIEKKDGPPKDKDVELEISNYNKGELEKDSKFILDYLKNKTWIKNLDEGSNIPGIEWEILVDRSQADKHGIDILTIGNSIQMVTHGLKISEFMPEDSDEEIDIVVKFNKQYRTLDELDRVEIQGKNGHVPLSLFVSRTAKPKIGNINRVDSKNSQNILFDIDKKYVVNNKVKEINNWLNKNTFKSIIKFRGEEEDQEEAKKFLIKAFFISIFLISVILIVTFESFYYAFIILTSVVMSTIGVMIGLIITQQPFGIVMSGIGIIALAGIVVNNNIVLIDTYRKLRKKSKDVKDAIVRTGAQRLRPVLLTTLTTFLGLIPMAIGLNINFLNQSINIGSPSSQWWLQLSNAIVFGIIFSFILTLIITPCLIYLGEKIKISN